MAKEFTGMHMLILGGSSGLGLAAARKLAGHGMGICIVHRNTRADMRDILPQFDLIRETGVPFTAFNADASDERQRREIIAALHNERGTFRCLLHSVAKGSLKAMHGQEDTLLGQDDFAITSRNMAWNLHDWVQDMRQAGMFMEDARVLAFTSEGSRRAMKHYAAVSAAKAALEAIVRSMALELAPVGIRANCIQAGITPTASMKRIPGSERMIEEACARNPFGRITSPEAVAGAVYLLCREEASWINGSIIPVDGGEHIC